MTERKQLPETVHFLKTLFLVSNRDLCWRAYSVFKMLVLVHMFKMLYLINYFNLHIFLSLCQSLTHSNMKFLEIPLGYEIHNQSHDEIL